VLLQHYRIDETHSNSYTVWNKLGSPQSPTAEQYAQLKDAGQLQLLSSPEWLDVSDGKITIANITPAAGYIADASEMVILWRPC
jgi:xylan 1,4-beta-xylosidase